MIPATMSQGGHLDDTPTFSGQYLSSHKKRTWGGPESPDITKQKFKFGSPGFGVALLFRAGWGD